jgi:hypothetical protein
LEVEEIYIDGFFVSLQFPKLSQNVTFSIYLSKPNTGTSGSVRSKVRYMGCFTSKRLIDLTDVPAPVAGDVGKVLSVSPDLGFQWQEGGSGGGLTCEDLPECPTIIDIYDNIGELYQVILDNIGTSIPKIRFGYLYNYWAINNLNLSSSSDWFVPVYVDFIAWANLFTTMPNLGAFLKQVGYDDILHPNTGALNTSMFSFIAGGNRGATGTFSGLLTFGDYRWSGENIYLGTATTRIINTSTNVTNSTLDKKTGTSSRLMRLNAMDPNGTFGEYIGNNGIIYKTVVYRGWEMTINNLAETKWRDGSDIPVVTSAATWAALSSAAMCAYNNDELYV